MKTQMDYVVVPTDIDELGHMNFDRYVWVFLDGRFDWFRKAGFSEALMAEKSLGAAIIKFETTYLRELLVGQEVTVETELVKVGTKSFTLAQKMFRGDELCSECVTVLVVMDLVKRVGIAVPEEIAGFLGK